jgi:hypothetical protein
VNSAEAQTGSVIRQPHDASLYRNGLVSFLERVVFIVINRLEGSLGSALGLGLELGLRICCVDDVCPIPVNNTVRDFLYAAFSVCRF